MKFLSVIHKSLLEQSRAFWLFLLTVLTAPFFVLVYNLINESYKPSYDILLVNNDHGYYIDPAGQVNLGDTLTALSLIHI